MASIVRDIDAARREKVRGNKDYVWGQIDNGGVKQLYLEYKWGPQKGERKVNLELKAAGARWLDRRTPEQKQLLEECEAVKKSVKCHSY